MKWVFFVSGTRFDTPISLCYNRPMKKNIVLTGFMGAGKSVTAKCLAVALGAPEYSTDSLVEQKAGQPISEIFLRQGEGSFRRLESEIVLGLAKKRGAIIDCGGGVVLNPENMKALRKNGIIFYLFATPEIVWERVKNQKHRPLLDVKDPLAEIQRLLSQREPLYRQADHTIDTKGLTGQTTCDAVLKILHE